MHNFQNDRDSDSPYHSLKTNVRNKTYDISQTPLFPLNYKELLEVVKILLKSGLPTSLSFVSTFVAGIICLVFVGRYGTPAELAGATLGFTWSSVFCVGIISSINQGFSIIASHLYGAQKHYELGILFQRNLFIVSIIIIPLVLSLWFAENILLAAGLNHDVSINTGTFLRWNIPGVISLALFESFKYYLIGLNCFYIQPIIQGSLAIVHIFWCYLFVDQYNMAVEGVALAKSITDIASTILIWIYIKNSSVTAQSWIPWNRICLDNCWPYLKQTMTLGANLYIEWISMEISLFIIGFLNDEYILGAHGIAVTLMNVFFMIPLGNSVSMQSYIGSAMGEGSHYKAQKFVVAGLGLNLCMTILNIIILVTCSGLLASGFTSDEKTRDILHNMLLIYAVSHTGETFANHLSGVLRTVGNEHDVLVVFMICYVGIGVNCEWIFGIALGYGYKAIWYSMGLGMYLMCIWAIKKTLNLDWESELVKIRKRTEEYVEMVEKV